jgi:putative Mg2+ transporter-C (MgtC) family protein
MSWHDLSAFDVAAQFALVFKVGLAAVLGGIVGFERDRAGKNAGIRTHMLVSSASSLAVGLGSIAVETVKGGDPTRMLHAVFTGIGFIGGGMIWTSSRTNGPQGLTSAATIMLVAGIGAACGIGAPIVAGAVTLFALITLISMLKIEQRLHLASDAHAETTAQPQTSKTADS